MYAYLTNLIKGHSDGNQGYDDNTSSIIIVSVRHPQDYAEHLKYVERIEHLKKKIEGERINI